MGQSLPSRRSDPQLGTGSFGVVHVDQQAHCPLIVGRTIGGDMDFACGAVQQFNAQACFQLLHKLRHRGLAHVQGLRRLGKAVYPNTAAS